MMMMNFQLFFYENGHDDNVYYYCFLFYSIDRIIQLKTTPKHCSVCVMEWSNVEKTTMKMFSQNVTNVFVVVVDSFFSLFNVFYRASSNSSKNHLNNQQ